MIIISYTCWFLRSKLYFFMHLSVLYYCDVMTFLKGSMQLQVLELMVSRSLLANTLVKVIVLCLQCLDFYTST